MWNLKNRTKQTNKRETNYRYREHFDGCQMGRELEGWAEDGKDEDVQLGSYTNRHRKVK